MINTFLISFTIFIILISLEKFIKIEKILIEDLYNFYINVSRWFERRKINTDDKSEVHPEEEFSNGLYDVNAFRERMSKLKTEKYVYSEPDKDGLRDVFIPKQNNYFTGVEVISDSNEIDIDRRINF